MTQAPSKPHDPHPLDAMTGGAFSAATSGERASRIREWLATGPTHEQLQEVFKELSARDKGAAKPLREKLDELKRAKGQELLAAEWGDKARVLLEGARLNIADALAWQRDAARAGAPLSREPLAGLKAQLAERVKGIEDLQHQAMVQREAAVLLAQRIEVLSTKPWRDAQNVAEALRADVEHWRAQADALVAHPTWPSVDAKYPPQLDASRTQLQVVWEAFSAALAQTVAAAQDDTAALPPVPVWADELRSQRGIAVAVPQEGVAQPAKLRQDTVAREARRQKSAQAVLEALTRVEQEVAEGHTKASAGAATALRNALREHGRHIDPALEARVHAALTAAGELEGWQRWRADQLREELVAKAEALFKRKPKAGAKAAAAPVSEETANAGAAEVESSEAAAQATAGADAADASVELVPVMGGRKMQETLRQLREQWKATDQGGVPNHALWKRFDAACNEAHKVVEAWLDKLKAEAAEHKAQRLALIEELKAWTAAHAQATDLKAINRALHQFADRWRDAGHLSEKAFAELQPQWKEAFQAAAQPLEAAQKASIERRQAMIEEAAQLCAAPVLRIDAVKAMQQRWQAEAQAVPLERKAEQKLWDAFRKPIDEAFNRKSAEREKAAAVMSERDKRVLDAAKALEAANASGDAQRIRAAMAALDTALKGQALAAAQEQAANAAERAEGAAAAGEPAAVVAGDDSAGQAPAESAAPPKPASRPVVAMRGDDRPGMKKAEPVAAVRGGRFGDRKGPQGAEARRDDRGSRDGGRFGDRGERGNRMGERRDQDRGPRLGDAAFRAQREALEHAQMALKKLAAQAHGETLTQLLGAWEQRRAEQLPSAQELGRAVTPAVRSAWAQALGAAPQGDAAEALLRLEMAAEVPTPADQLNARRALQLQLLTRRNDPSPAQTWGQDAARVLASGYEAGNARRLQSVLKTLLRG